MAGLPCTQWIARCAAEVVREERPDLTLVYLPHLDYDPQRFGPGGCDMPRLVGELDAACDPLLDAARRGGARVWVVSEYGHVAGPAAGRCPTACSAQAGLLTVRPGPFGETARHVRQPGLRRLRSSAGPRLCPRRGRRAARARGAGRPAGRGRVLAGEERAEFDLRHPRAGELVALAEPDAWFAYPFWLDDQQAPDYARTVDIHRKPGYDPCELFFDPQLWWPKGRAAWRLLQKKLGFRTLFDVIPLDAALVRGSHGLPAADRADRPLLIGDGPPPSTGELPMTGVRDLLLAALDLAP